jgi:hypothetical protein
MISSKNLALTIKLESVARISLENVFRRKNTELGGLVPVPAFPWALHRALSKPFRLPGTQFSSL